MDKTFLRSKTLWVAVVSLIAILIQTQTGFFLPPETQAIIVTLLMMVMRGITQGKLRIKPKKTVESDKV